MAGFAWRLRLSHLSRRAVLFGACAVLVVGTTLSAAAQYVPPVGYRADRKDGLVTVNGRVAVRFHVANAGLSPVERARLTARRLKPLARGGWKLIGVKPVGRKRAQLRAGDELICRVSALDARANRMSALAVARSWAGRLRWLFAQPPISVKPDEITVPENETRTVAVGGVAPGPLSTAGDNAAVATSEVHPTKRAIVIRGKSVGRCTVRATCRGYNAWLVVNVRRYAGKVVGAAYAEVTGAPAPRRLIEKAASVQAARIVALEPGAVASFGQPRVSVASLSQGERTRALIPVTVRGENLIPISMLAPVEVRHRSVAYAPTASLFYSNNPERITHFGTLFTSKLEAGDRHRLLYHHQNAAGRRVRFVVELVNLGASPAQVQTVSGVAPPSLDTVIVGYQAGMSFIKDYLGDIGQVRRMPPKSKLAVYAEDLGQMMTASGIVDLRLLSGEDVYLRVAAEPPSRRALYEGQVAPVSDGETPTDLSPDVFAAPTRNLEAWYTVGDQWAFIRIGGLAVNATTDGHALDGNYGVIYHIKVHMKNPASEARDVRILFEPTAGPAAGVFVVGGRVTGVRIVVPPNEFEITSVRLAPGESKDISLMTLPLAGSAYPAMIVVRS